MCRSLHLSRADWSNCVLLPESICEMTCFTWDNLLDLSRFDIPQEDCESKNLGSTRSAGLHIRTIARTSYFSSLSIWLCSHALNGPRGQPFAAQPTSAIDNCKDATERKQSQ